MIDNLIAAMDACETGDDMLDVIDSYVESGRIVVFGVKKGFAGIESDGVVVVKSPYGTKKASVEEFDALLISEDVIERYSDEDGLKKMFRFCCKEMIENEQIN